MATKRPTAADDSFRVLSTLVSALNLASQAYDRDKNWEAESLLFIAGLNADEIERSSRRALRKRSYLVSDPYGSSKWARLPEVLDLGRTLVAEHEEKQRQQENGGAA